MHHVTRTKESGTLLSIKKDGIHGYASNERTPTYT
jgi:hypothetical protein